MTIDRGAGSAPAAAAFFFLALLMAAARAQDSGGLTIVPSFSAQETLTTNRDSASSNPQADSITQVSPGFRISSPAGRVRGSLSYVLSALHYARASHSDSLQNSLDGALTADGLEGHASVDARASISQQSISAFGTQTSDNSLVNSNRTEVSTLSVVPSLHGNVAGWFDVGASLNWATSSSASTQLGDSSVYGGQVNLSGRQGLFSWGLNAGRQVSDYKLGRTTDNDNVGGSLTFAPRYDLNFSLRVGRAASDVLSGSRTWIQTTGWGASWQPTDRTDIALQSDRTYYGHSHSYSLRHRMARSVWSYSDATNASGPGNAQGAAAPLTLYDLLYAICLNSGGSAISCDQTVRDSLLRQGLSPTGLVGGGFLSSALTLQRSQTLAFSLSGQRSTVTMSAFRTSTSILDPLSAVSGDLAQGNPVRQQGFSLGVSHQLTQSASLAFSASQQKTLDAGAQAGNQQRAVTLTWVVSPGPRTNVSLSARHSEFTSSSNPYQESAILGSLGVRF